MAKKSSADGEYRISLTGPDSHRLVLEPGVGSLSIGPGKAGLVVEPGVPIQWTALDQFATPAGSAWPRWLTYTGDDVGVFEWARKRAIEGLDWTPTRALEVDARAARISDLTITLRGHALRMRMPDRLSSLSIGGDIALLEASGAMPESVTLAPMTSRRGDGATRLPDLGAFAGVTHLAIHNEPMHRPISLLGLEKLGALESLALHGAIADLETVASLPKLASLALRFMPSLEGLPPLSALPGLDSIIVYNVDEQASKSMRQQLKDQPPSAKISPTRSCS